jgi:hypothetical protein
MIVKDLRSAADFKFKLERASLVKTSNSRGFTSSFRFTKYAFRKGEVFSNKKKSNSELT